ncbi:MAG TPA: hypothetical protein VJ861_08485 [Treponemataceae bacterium]|nr:hypothetical protein [Treponemataceae bacterium]
MMQDIIRIKKCKKTFRLYFTASVILTVTLLCGCASTAPTVDMREWSEKATKKGTVLVRYPKDSLQIRGSIQQESPESTIFYVEEIQWFSNWNDGWTESLILASGKARLVKGKGKTRSAEFIEPVTLEETQEAAIRYRDTILRGTDARVAFSRRLDRISASIAFLIEYENQTNNDPRDKSEIRLSNMRDKKTFVKNVRQLFFPEVYGFPKGFIESPRINENRERGEGINWDLRYTEKVFPPEFAAIRNSGTLFRDWEETADLFYFIFCMESLKHD